jgi:hypothetical protein
MQIACIIHIVKAHEIELAICSGPRKNILWGENAMLIKDNVSGGGNREANVHFAPWLQHLNHVLKAD